MRNHELLVVAKIRTPEGVALIWHPRAIIFRGGNLSLPVEYGTESIQFSSHNVLLRLGQPASRTP